MSLSPIEFKNVLELLRNVLLEITCSLLSFVFSLRVQNEVCLLMSNSCVDSIMFSCMFHGLGTNSFPTLVKFQGVCKDCLKKRYQRAAGSQDKQTLILDKYLVGYEGLTPVFSVQDPSEDPWSQEEGGVRSVCLTVKWTVQSSSESGSALTVEEPGHHLWGLVLCHLGVL